MQVSQLGNRRCRELVRSLILFVTYFIFHILFFVIQTFLNCQTPESSLTLNGVEVFSGGRGGHCLPRGYGRDPGQVQNICQQANLNILNVYPEVSRNILGLEVLWVKANNRGMKPAGELYHRKKK